MEYLVTMTTRVPAGVSEREVDEVREREAVHTAELVRAGRVRRLWRPPVKPDEWRTLGLFAADSDAGLADVLESMPLRVWRTDEVTALAAHPNDPGSDAVPLDLASNEFFTTFLVTVPPGAHAAEVTDLKRREALRTQVLARAGHLLRLWRLPDGDRILGHWQARDGDQLDALLASLPMAPWLGIETLPLTRHPNDPGPS